jgi:hypothetical protein
LHGSLLLPEDEVVPELPPLDPPLLLLVLFPHASIASQVPAETMQERISAENPPHCVSQSGGVAWHFVVMALQTSPQEAVEPPDEVPLLPPEGDVDVVSEAHAPMPAITAAMVRAAMDRTNMTALFCTRPLARPILS